MSPEVTLFLVLVAAIAGLHFHFQERKFRKAAFMVHIQGRTEEAEQMDFAVSLFEDESPEEWEKKMDKAFYLCEKRRSFNNERLLGIMEMEKQKLLDSKEAEKKK